jgi:Domain of unknown function (DUF5122) beta-propeller
MKKFIKNIVLFLLFPSMFFSCEDLFHDASSVLEEISDNYEIPEPKRIFVGGNIYYSIDVVGREALYVTNGYGNLETDFFTAGNHGIMISGASGARIGVLDMELTDEFLYVGGNFQGYDSTNTYSTDMQYQLVQRYWLDGSFDNSYTPFNGLSANPEIYSIEILADGTLLAGGNFNLWYGYEELVRLKVDGTGSETFPAALTTSNIYSLEKIFEDQILMVGGVFTNFGGIPGFDNFSAVELIGLGAADPAGFSIIPDTTEVRDFASFNNQLFVAGSETALMDGILYKYLFDGSNFIADTAFNTDFTANLTDLASFNKVNTVAIDDLGRIYIGGQFTNQQDESGSNHDNIMRITTDGRIDSSFRAETDGEIFVIEIQDNGKILLGGQFYNVNGESSYDGFVRLEEYGSIDHGIDYESLPGGTVYSIAIVEEPTS